MAEVAQDLFTQNRAAGRLRESQQAAQRERLFAAANQPTAPPAINFNQLQAANEAPSAQGRLIERQQQARREQNQPTSESLANKNPNVRVKSSKKEAPVASGLPSLKRAQQLDPRQALKNPSGFLGMLARDWLDRYTPMGIISAIFDLGFTAILVMQTRAIASLPPFKNGGILPFFHELRYTDKTIFEAVAPDATRMRPPRLTPLTAWISLLFLYAVIAIMIACIVIVIIAPMQIIYEAGYNPLKLKEAVNNPLVAPMRPLINAIVPFF